MDVKALAKCAAESFRFTLRNCPQKHLYRRRTMDKLVLASPNNRSNARILLLVKVFFVTIAVSMLLNGSILSMLMGSRSFGRYFWLAVALAIALIVPLRLLENALRRRLQKGIPVRAAIILLAACVAAAAMGFTGAVATWLLCVILSNAAIDGLVWLRSKWLSRHLRKEPGDA